VQRGHAEADAEDGLVAGERLLWLPGERVETANTHGSGCTLSAAITAGLARGLELEPAVRDAKRFITGAIRQSIEIGGGHGPVNPMWELPER
jgi:hydroxymethylpyrimidine/phosphomethylpyrimidine kinase